LLFRSLVCTLVLLVNCSVCTSVLAAEDHQEAVEFDQEGAEVDEGVIWLPKVAFPPTDPTREAGYLPLIHRDISFRYGPAQLYLSIKRGLEITLDNSNFFLRVHGRAFVDGAYYLEDKNDLGQQGIGLRTVLVEMDGRLSERWYYRFSWGGLTNGGRFDTSGVFLDDAYFSRLGEKSAWVIGQQGEPFSLEERTSSLATTFMERALPNALVPGNSVGVAFHTNGERWGMIIGAFLEDLASEKDAGDQGMGLTGRFFFRPRSPEDKIYHLGCSVSGRSITSVFDKVFFRYRPESGLTDVRYVNTGDIQDVDFISRFDVEGALVSGPWSVQAEYIGTWVNGAGFEDLFFNGWYAFVSWFPTGESRGYSPREGIFTYPEIKSKWGAVELAARYSTVDLTDGSITGGIERNVSFGVNWYISSQVRLMANYILVFTDDNANDNGAVMGSDNPQIFQLRLQFRN
jgi:phosphate-selective porin OprO/OprP